MMNRLDEMYDRGYHDGCIFARKRAEVLLTEKLAKLTSEDAYAELDKLYNEEKAEEVYKAYHDAYHKVCAIVSILEAEKNVSELAKMLVEGIRDELEQAYHEASIDMEEITYNREAFVAECAGEKGVN